MINYKNFLLILIFCCSFSYSQTKDTIFSSVKSVREKLTFLNKEKQNLKLFNFEDEYGHHGFYNPGFTKNRFYLWWFETPWTHYVNYYKEFKKNGQPTSEIWFRKNRDTLETFLYKYDKIDNLIQKKEISSYDTKTTNYTYNYKNQLISELIYSSKDQNDYHYKYYIYNNEGNLIEINKYDEKGINYGERILYNKNQRKKKVFHRSYYKRYYKPNGSYLSKKGTEGVDILDIEYFYDNLGRRTEIHFYSEDDENHNSSILNIKQKNTYSKGLLVNKTFTRKNITDKFIKYRYNSKGRKIRTETSFYNLPKKKKSIEYFYNLKGDLIKIIYDEKEKTSIIEFEYVFDEYGNWIKQLKTINGEKLFIWSREIEYY